MKMLRRRRLFFILIFTLSTSIISVSPTLEYKIQQDMLDEIEENFIVHSPVQRGPRKNREVEMTETEPQPSGDKPAAMEVDEEADETANATVPGSTSKTTTTETNGNGTVVTKAKRTSQISDNLALYLGIAAACVIAAWLILGPTICLLVHARRKWQQRHFQDSQLLPSAANSSGSWLSRWGRGGPPIRASTPPRIGNGSKNGDETSIPLHPRTLREEPPTITLTQPYNTPTMTTFGGNSLEEHKNLVQRDELQRTDI